MAWHYVLTWTLRVFAFGLSCPMCDVLHVTTDMCVSRVCGRDFEYGSDTEYKK